MMKRLSLLTSTVIAVLLLTLGFGLHAQNANPNSFTDGAVFMSAQALGCTGATTGTVGTGNGTYILDGSVSALKISATNAGASVNTFTCPITTPPSRTTAGKGVTLTGLTIVYSVQTTTATSMTLPTLTSFTAPVAGTSETASSATLVASAGGTLTPTPAVASANLTAVSAGQYYTEAVSLGTPLALNNPLQTVVLTFVVSQSASAAQIVTLPGVWELFSQTVF